ncbi:hypothetical protein HYY73_05340 [Candidatus Woesearchaeota archaeon]|nr:hypothetical protein [Candidatus Woesearchaeota archaeon]
MKEWRKLVEEIKNNKRNYAGILRGFFAGEGSIKEGKHCSRILRMAQAKRVTVVEQGLEFFKIDYEFSKHHREGYVIRRKENFDKAAAIGLADLHPDKKNRFNRMLNKYKQKQYRPNYLKSALAKVFDSIKPYTTEQLAKTFDRSNYRIWEILSELKKEGIIVKYRIRSKDYWTLNNGVILISSIKYKYLCALKSDAKRTKDLADDAGVCWKAAFRRLKELEGLGLIKRKEDGMWEVMNTNKEVVPI